MQESKREVELTPLSQEDQGLLDELSQKHTCNSAEEWNKLGNQYVEGKDDVNKNFNLAFICYYQSNKIEPNNPEANYFLGRFYVHGEGTKRNERLGYQYYRRSAIQGHASAIRALQRARPQYKTQEFLYYQKIMGLQQSIDKLFYIPLFQLGIPFIQERTIHASYLKLLISDSLLTNLDKIDLLDCIFKKYKWINFRRTL